jgi:hypothetical protein
MDVIWDGKNEKLTINNKKDASLDRDVVPTKETAIIIGRALLDEYFGEYISFYDIHKKIAIAPNCW